MRRVVLLASVVLALGVVAPGSALADAGGSDLPLTSSGSGSATLNIATGQINTIGSGMYSHFGATAGEDHAQLVPTGPGTFSWFGTWTVTASNGDQMFGTATGSVSIAADGIHGTSLIDYTSTGGTGRFADATMTFVATVHTTTVSAAGTTVNFSFNWTATGQLSYR